MPFQVSLQKHFKIWLSVNPQVGLNPLNQRRLQEFSSSHPHLQITLVYCAELLTPEADQALCMFLSEQNIVPFNIPLASKAQDVFFRTHKFDEVDKQLYAIVVEELKNLKSWGNPARASDILRLLLLKLGIYSDLDTTVRVPVTMLSKPVIVNTPILWPSIVGMSNNDVIVLSDPGTDPLLRKAQTSLLLQIKSTLLHNYNNFNVNLREFRERVGSQTFSDKESNDFVNHLNQLMHEDSALRSDIISAEPMTLAALTKRIRAAWATPWSYLRTMGVITQLSRRGSASGVTEETAGIFLEAIYRQAGIENVSGQEIVDNSFATFVKTSTLLYTGSGTLPLSDTQHYNLFQYSFLRHCFKHSLQLMQDPEVRSDTSWLPCGVKEMFEKERNLVPMEAPARVILRGMFSPPPRNTTSVAPPSPR